MMYRVFAAFLLLTTATASLAEPPIGSLLGNRMRPGRQAGPADAAAIAHDYARCVINKNERYARTMLLAKTKAEADGALTRISQEFTCYSADPSKVLGDSMIYNFPAVLQRGLFAEEIVSRHRSEAAALPPLPIEKIYVRSWFPITGRNVVVDELAACMADTHPAEVTSVLLTKGFSKEESAAMAAIGPYLGPCIRAGNELHANRQLLRGAMAEGLFQRLYNTSASTSSPSASAGSVK